MNKVLKKHSIFASSCAYPIKGFHYLLEAFAQVVKAYPDATLTVTGRSFLAADLRGKLRQSSYERYLASLVRKYHLEEKLIFLGSLGASQMKQAFLDANVFVLSSILENSPNSLGEAMLLGVPSVAADVGGVRDLMCADTEGLIYNSGDTDALASHIMHLFSLEEKAAQLGYSTTLHRILPEDIALFQELKELMQ